MLTAGGSHLESGPHCRREPPPLHGPHARPVGCAEMYGDGPQRESREARATCVVDANDLPRRQATRRRICWVHHDRLTTINTFGTTDRTMIQLAVQFGARLV